MSKRFFGYIKIFCIRINMVVLNMNTHSKRQTNFCRKLLGDLWAISRWAKWNNDAASVKVGTRRKWIRGQMDSGLKFQKISKINSSIIITGDTGATIMTSWSIFRIWSDHLPNRSSPPILIIFANFTLYFLCFKNFWSFFFEKKILTG